MRSVYKIVSLSSEIILIHFDYVKNQHRLRISRLLVSLLRKSYRFVLRCSRIYSNRLRLLNSFRTLAISRKDFLVVGQFLCTAVI